MSLNYETRKVGEYIHVKGESILPDNYPVHAGYIYLVDGLTQVSDISGTVFDLKWDARAEEVRNCNLAERGIL